MSPETKELTVSPTSGLVPSTTPAALRSPSAVTQSAPAMQPMVQFGSQFLAILSDIDSIPSPFASPDAALEQPVCASPLTERALRYQRREASRTGRSTVASTPLPSPTNSPDPLDDFRHPPARGNHLTSLYRATFPLQALNNTVQLLPIAN